MLTTLGTMTIFQGVALLTAGGYYCRVPRDSAFNLIADGFVGPIAVPTIIFLGLALVMHLSLSETSLVARVYAIGEDEKAAKLAGGSGPVLPDPHVHCDGLSPADAAMVVSARAGSGHHFVGLNYEFHAITAGCPGWELYLRRQGSALPEVSGVQFLSPCSTTR